MPSDTFGGTRRDLGSQRDNSTGGAKKVLLSFTRPYRILWHRARDWREMTITRLEEKRGNTVTCGRPERAAAKLRPTREWSKNKTENNRIFILNITRAVPGGVHLEPLFSSSRILSEFPVRFLPKKRFFETKTCLSPHSPRRQSDSL